MTLTKGKHSRPTHLFPATDFSSSMAVLFWLCASLVSFYAVFYITSSLMHGVFKLDNFDGTLPFHYKSFKNIFTNATKWETQPFLGDFISLECTYLFSTFVFLAFLRRRLWDFAFTVTVIHCAITCAVNASFPLVWEWWICILIGLVMNITVGQFINSVIKSKQNGVVDSNKSRNGAVS